jgi:DNA-binding GntR family transcriptional regulator
MHTTIRRRGPPFEDNMPLYDHLPPVTQIIVYHNDTIPISTEHTRIVEALFPQNLDPTLNRSIYDAQNTLNNHPYTISDAAFHVDSADGTF